MRVKIGVFVLFILMSFFGTAFGDEPQVVSVSTKGNIKVDSNYIIGAVETKAGEPLDREKLQRDVESIYELGFFSYVDMELSQNVNGVEVTFVVSENPVIESIKFEGNTVFKNEDLMKVVFTQEGAVFNRVFFKNDLDRIQEKYAKDGYVMVRVADVVMNGGNITVKISEPKIGNIIILGNKKTKTNIISREIKLKKGDLFNATIFRHQLGRLNSLGFFEDVNVAFDQGDAPDTSDIILTVVEKKTSSIGFNVGYGSDGFIGGITYKDSNWAGLGHLAEIGFELGYEQQYWLSYSSPYMDKNTYGWKTGAYIRNLRDRYYYHEGKKQFEYDEESKGIYAGFGKKFGGTEKFGWFLTFDWRDVSYSDPHKPIAGYYNDLTDWAGKNFSTELTLSYNDLDPYLSYSKGFLSELYVTKAYDFLGGEFDYLKYWLQMRYYLPIDLNRVLGDVVDLNDLLSEEKPLIFASRIRIGGSSVTDLPAFARYSLGGDNTLRGYDSRSFEGSKMILGNFELRVPIQSAFTLVGFFDIGNAGNDISYFSDLNSNYGMGVRVSTPMGNLRLDYAMGGNENRFYFGFGETF